MRSRLDGKNDALSEHINAKLPRCIESFTIVSASRELVTVVLPRLVLSAKIAPQSLEALTIASPSPFAVRLIY